MLSCFHFPLPLAVKCLVCNYREIVMTITIPPPSLIKLYPVRFQCDMIRAGLSVVVSLAHTWNQRRSPTEIGWQHVRQLDTGPFGWGDFTACVWNLLCTGELLEGWMYEWVMCKQMKPEEDLFLDRYGPMYMQHTVIWELQSLGNRARLCMSIFRWSTGLGGSREWSVCIAFL